MLKKISVIFLVTLHIGCSNQKEVEVNVQKKLENEQEVSTNYNYVSNYLNDSCKEYLADNFSDYWICNNWGLNINDIENIIQLSKKYQKDFISTHSLLSPTEIRINKIIEKKGELYIFYPNGFFIKFKNKIDYEDWLKGYREFNQSFICVSDECKKYFLWDFLDEAIVAEFEESGKSYPSNFRSSYDDILETPLSINLNASKNFIFKKGNLNINDQSCTYIVKDNTVRDCFYYILSDVLYVYDKKHYEVKGLILEYKLK